MARNLPARARRRLDSLRRRAADFWAWALAPHEAPDGFLLARWLHLRLLGAVFAVAFLGLSREILGLLGPEGILPAGELLAEVARASGPLEKLHRAPTLLWLGSGAGALQALCWGGLAASALLILNVCPRLSVFLCWALFASFASVAYRFSQFQSDEFLLENALLAALLAPRGLRPGLGRGSPPSRACVWLFWWLTFRIMFQSGLGKLVSADPSWRALDIHDYYHTNPFPTLLSWHLHQLPRALSAASAVATFFVEALVPFGIFLGPRARLGVFALWTLLQLGIMATGSFAFVNVNAVAAALLLLDDRTLARLLPRKLARHYPSAPSGVGGPNAGRGVRGWRSWGLRAQGALMALLFYATAVWFFVTLPDPYLNPGNPISRLPEPLLMPLRLLQPLRSANRYRLYIAMDHERRQIEFEGSRDGTDWRPYPFRWPPHPDAAPRLQAPYHPRFDWFVYFASRGGVSEYPEVLKIAERLLEGRPDVLALFAADPFPEGPPAMIRFPVYRYRFTDRLERRETGRYWQRELLRYYAPILYRDPDSGAIELAGPRWKVRLPHATLAKFRTGAPPAR